MPLVIHIQSGSSALTAQTTTVRLSGSLDTATAPELEHHPASRAVHVIRHGAYGLTHASHRFVITYLLIHGLIKLALVVNLMIERMWVFPVSVALLLGFIAVMGVKLSHHWSNWLFAFAMFDVITVALVAHEWRMRRQG